MNSTNSNHVQIVVTDFEFEQNIRKLNKKKGKSILNIIIHQTEAKCFSQMFDKLCIEVSNMSTYTWKNLKRNVPTLFGIFANIQASLLII